MAHEVSTEEGQSLWPPFTAYRGDEPYIFVSYSHKDKVLVYPDLVRLHEAGYRIWYDEGIVTGEIWTKHIAEALLGCSVFIIWISSHAIASKYVEREVHMAMNHNKACLTMYLEETQLPGAWEYLLSPIQAIYKYHIPDGLFWQKLQEGLQASMPAKDAPVPPCPALPVIPPPPIIDTRAHLALATIPPGAVVSIEGDTLDEVTPCDYEHDLGGHMTCKVEVEITLDSYEPHHAPVTLHRGKTQPYTITLTPEPHPGEVRVNPRDGAKMVWVPAGEFLMGSKEGEGRADERPRHSVYLTGYWIYRTEVTVAQYRTFCRATGREMPILADWSKDNHPMVNVEWNDAAAYAAWAGAALPTEAQWEKAARGTDGRSYPWGNKWDAAKCCNSVGGNNPGQTLPVGSFPAGASAYGCLDMAGNVWEWCADWYDADYYQNAPTRNPRGKATGTMRVLRGGGWYHSTPDRFRVSYRICSHCPADRYYHLGFRCVLPPPEP